MVKDELIERLNDCDDKDVYVLIDSCAYEFTVVEKDDSILLKPKKAFR